MGEEKWEGRKKRERETDDAIADVRNLDERLQQ